jgi:hypothetical protein
VKTSRATFRGSQKLPPFIRIIIIIIKVSQVSLQLTVPAVFVPKKKMDGRFAAYGGFLLMDGEGKVVKALAVGDDRDTVLKFGAAKPWGSAEALKELDSAGRLQVALC